MNFNFILSIAFLLTGSLWAFERWRFRSAKTQSSEGRDAEQIRLENVDFSKKQGVRKLVWLEYMAGFFPVVAWVFVLRSFVVEPFKIPSESMLPTLFVGDLILVNKFIYGLRLPIFNVKLLELSAPNRGDVIVFRFPQNTSVDYIKRVVAVPGDEIRYKDQTLTINGERIPTELMEDFEDTGKLMKHRQFSEKIGQSSHHILAEKESNASIQPIVNFPFFDSCTYDRRGVVCRVPTGNFFVMGDNRGNSLDSRFWGFVPEENIVGKAFFIWMNFSSLGRIGKIK